MSPAYEAVLIALDNLAQENGNRITLLNELRDAMRNLDGAELAGLLNRECNAAEERPTIFGGKETTVSGNCDHILDGVQHGGNSDLIDRLADADKQKISDNLLAVAKSILESNDNKFKDGYTFSDLMRVLGRLGKNQEKILALVDRFAADKNKAVFWQPLMEGLLALHAGASKRGESVVPIEKAALKLAGYFTKELRAASRKDREVGMYPSQGDEFYAGLDKIAYASKNPKPFFESQSASLAIRTGDLGVIAKRQMFLADHKRDLTGDQKEALLEHLGALLESGPGTLTGDSRHSLRMDAIQAAKRLGPDARKILPQIESVPEWLGDPGVKGRIAPHLISPAAENSQREVGKAIQRIKMAPQTADIENLLSDTFDKWKSREDITQHLAELEKMPKDKLGNGGAQRLVDSMWEHLFSLNWQHPHVYEKALSVEPLLKLMMKLDPDATAEKFSWHFLEQIRNSEKEAIQIGINPKTANADAETEVSRRFSMLVIAATSNNGDGQVQEAFMRSFHKNVGYHNRVLREILRGNPKYQEIERY